MACEVDFEDMLCYCEARRQHATHHEFRNALIERFASYWNKAGKHVVERNERGRVVNE